MASQCQYVSVIFVLILTSHPVTLLDVTVRVAKSESVKLLIAKESEPGADSCDESYKVSTVQH